MAIRYCNHLGCRELTKGRYCKAHEHLREREIKQTRAEYDATRPNANVRGYDYQWHKYTRYYLRNHPLCVVCEKLGYTTPAQCVDHIISVSGPKDPLFWKPDNHQALCFSCHSSKTIREDKKGFGKPRINDLPVG